MRDEWDERSIIVVAFKSRQLCGSIRVIVNSATDKLSYPAPYPQDLAASGSQPVKMIRIGEYVESSRLCIAPEYPGKGLYGGRELWYLLAACMVIVGYETGRNYIVGSATDELVPIWRKIGFEKTGYRYFNEDIAGKDHEMLVLDIAQVLNGHCNKAFHQVLLKVWEGSKNNRSNLSIFYEA